MEKYCCKRVFTGSSIAGSCCSNKPSKEHDGKTYCAIHYPPAEQERRKKLSEKWEAESKIAREERKAAFNKQAELEAKAAKYDALVSALKSLVGSAGRAYDALYLYDSKAADRLQIVLDDAVEALKEFAK